MNLLDIAVLFVILLFILNGLYRGFLPSLLNLCGFFVSWVASFLLYPVLSARLMRSGFFSSLKFYIEGAERIGTGEAFELSKLSVQDISPQMLNNILDNASLPPPYDKAVAYNVSNRVYADKGIETLGDYFNETIFNVIMNIFSFLIIFICLMVVLNLLTNAFSFAVKLPELRHFDMLTGALTAVIRSFFFLFVMFTAIPVILVLLPVSFVTDMVNSSVACSIFYSGSIILGFIAV